ncbi:MAG: hypothetical protein DRO88_04590 [Promethearchaeia archaeon]|nr:MAG: hypothetical protein DRO88_04590 [Candidatus Lokiarchaeia archaeon]
MKPINRKLLRVLIWLVMIVFIITIGLAWWFYPDQYKFWQYFISEFGARETLLGHPNTASMYIFGLGIMLCGLITFIMALIYFIRNEKSILHILKGLSLLTISVGTLGIMNPYDLVQNHFIHPLGATLFVIGLDIYTFFCQFLRFKNRKITLDTGEPKPITFDKYFVFLILAVSIAFLVLAILNIKSWLPPMQKVILILSVFGIAILDLDDF